MRKYAYGYKDLKDLERGLEDERSRVRVESALGIIFRVSYDEGPTYLEHFLRRRGHEERLVGALLSAFEANEESLLLEAGQGLASLGTDALSRLCELYEDVHMRTQYWIVRALGGVQTDEPCVLSCLRAALHSDDEYLQLEAIKVVT